VSRRWTLILGLALAGAALDLWTKSLAFSCVAPDRTVTVVPGILRFQLATNRGTVWGLFPSRLWAAASILAIPVILAAIARTRRPGPAEGLSGAAILAGALGNGWDRLVLGFVRDFILVRPIPNFNLADLWVNLGAGGLLCLWIFHDRRSVRPPGTSRAGQPHDGGLGDVRRDHGPGA
jgi:signal peptidase II